VVEQIRREVLAAAALAKMRFDPPRFCA